MVGILLFFLIAFSLLALGHYYVWRRMVRATGLNGRGRRWATWWLVAAPAVIMVAWLVSRAVPREYLGALSALAFTWKGLLFYLVVGLGLWELPRLVAWLVRRRRPSESGSQEARADAEALPRRTFLARVAAGTTLASGLGFSAVGVRNAVGDIETPEVSVPLARLPRALEGYRIAVISDVHLGPLLGEDFLRRVVERTNVLQPDAVVIVGDLVDGPVSMLASDVAPLAGLRSRDGTFFVTGNHEYYSGAREWGEHLSSIGVRVLANQRVAIGDSHPGGASFDLAGIHDPTARRFRDAGDPPDLDAALAGRDPEREVVLLAHQPLQVDDAARCGVGLQISGHTHGGQIWPFGALTALAQPYLRGLHRHTDRTWIYVTCGTGFWGPPMRVLAPAEITQIVLTAG